MKHLGQVVWPEKASRQETFADEMRVELWVRKMEEKANKEEEKTQTIHG